MNSWVRREAAVPTPDRTSSSLPSVSESARPVVTSEITSDWQFRLGTHRHVRVVDRPCQADIHVISANITLGQKIDLGRDGRAGRKIDRPGRDFIALRTEFYRAAFESHSPRDKGIGERSGDCERGRPDRIDLLVS